MLYGRHWPLRGGLRGQEGRRVPHLGPGGRGQEKLRGSLWPWASKAWLEADFAPPAACRAGRSIFIIAAGSAAHQRVMEG